MVTVFSFFNLLELIIYVSTSEQYAEVRYIKSPKSFYDLGVLYYIIPLCGISTWKQSGDRDIVDFFDKKRSDTTTLQNVLGSTHCPNWG